jgi:hypothetical protein
MKAEDIFESKNIEALEDDGLYIEVDPDRGIYAQVTKHDAIRLAKFFEMTCSDLDVQPVTKRVVSSTDNT